MSQHNPEKPADGAAFDRFFESLGKKAEHLTTVPASSSGGVETIGNSMVEDEQKVVDEIESLCMNCQKNVSNSLNLKGDF